MSGIVGCAGKGDLPGLLLQGLQRLEYLGYDSAGLAVVHEGALKHQKCTGGLRQLTARIDESFMGSEVGIAGLRFATHGEPNRVNAHPQIDCEGSIAAVHCGVIENHKELKKRLLAVGHRFRSQTDTEVLAHLVEERTRGAGFLEAYLGILADLKGSLAFMAIDKSRPGEIFCGCLEYDLWIGSSHGMTIVSSEIAPLIAHTRQAVKVHGDFVIRIRADVVEVFGLDGRPRPVKQSDITWNLAQAQRDGYASFTMKEIHEQAVTIRRAFSSRISDRGVDLQDFGLSRKDLKSIESVTCVGSGSSLHAALIAQGYVREFGKMPSIALPSSEPVTERVAVNQNALMVAISQSGRNRDTVIAAQEWKAKGGKVLTISNSPGSPLWNLSDGVLGTYSGPEIGITSTKTYTGELVTSLLFALNLGRTRDALKSVPEREVIHGIEALPGKILDILERKAQIERIAHEFVNARSAFFAASGRNFPPALEGALKMKQLASIHAEAIPFGELKHEVLGLMDADNPVLALASNGWASDRALDAIVGIKDSGGKVILIADGSAQGLQERADATFLYPTVSSLLEPVPVAVVFQLLAAYVAQLRKFDLDAPKNLRKYFA